MSIDVPKESPGGRPDLPIAFDPSLQAPRGVTHVPVGLDPQDVSSGRIAIGIVWIEEAEQSPGSAAHFPARTDSLDQEATWVTDFLGVGDWREREAKAGEQTQG